MLSLLVPSGQVVLFQYSAAGQIVFESDVALYRFATVRVASERFSRIRFEPVSFPSEKLAGRKFKTDSDETSYPHSGNETRL